MAYVPTVWATGDVITAEKLNKAEEGIASASMKLVVIDANQKDASNKIYLSDADQEIVQAAWDSKIPAFYVKAVPLDGSSDPEYEIHTVTGVGFYDWGNDNIPTFDLSAANNISGVSSIQTFIRKDETGWYGTYYSD